MSVVHELVLQPELFYLCYDVNRPTSKAGFIADELYNQFKGKDPTDEAIIAVSNKIDYYKGQMTDKRIAELRDKCNNYWKTRAEYEKNSFSNKTPIYLDPKSRERVQQCVQALSQNKRVQDLLTPTGIITEPISECEQAILLDILVEIENKKPFILSLKSKLDNYTIDTESNAITINDVKTIGRIVSEFNSNIERFHYNRELSMYSWLLSLCAKKFFNMDNPTIKANYLVVSTIPSYYTKVVSVTKKMFIEGWKELSYLLKLVAKYVSEDYKEFGLWMN